MTAPIASLLQRFAADAAPLAALEKLHGDASYRTYYRAHLADGRTLIVMQLPEGKSSASEEITNFPGTPRELPFVNIARFLTERGIPVPRIIGYSPEDHLMLLEDLGSTHFADVVATADDSVRADWYRRAIALLVELQRKTAGASPEACIALQRSFDTTLLDWEFDHFLEYGLEQRGVALAAGDRALFTAQTRAISRRIASLPYGFTHRDYQSRNLLVRNGALALIDFQDALLGPAVYDLVALLRDSYIVLPPQLVEELVADYARLSARDSAEVARQFHLVTVQRKLKDAGRFVFIDRVKGNPGYLPFIPGSLRSVRQALAQLPEYADLAALLSRTVPEWPS